MIRGAQSLVPGVLILTLLFFSALVASTSDKAAAAVIPKEGIEKKQQRAIQGRFLEITDIHPDPKYKPFTSTESCCHYGDGKDEGEEGSTWKYGLPNSRCDTPLILVNDTLTWIKENIHGTIDFVVWTGDNVRHDRDRRTPRTEPEIFDANELMVNTLKDFFGTGDIYHPYEIPIIPNIGNNDVYPHNMLVEGPTLQTREFYRIYRDLVPEAQVHIFNRGMHFVTEVIPDKLAVISINTIYWFDTNPAVDGCDRKKDPGSLQFRWLRVVLNELRSRGMKAWVAGHVPPSQENWEPSCRDRFIAWSHEYRDVVLGGLWGHMNLDHFLFHDVKEAYKLKKKEGVANEIGRLDIAEGEEVEEDDGQLPFNRNKKYKKLSPLQRQKMFNLFENDDNDEFTIQNKLEYLNEVRLSYEKAYQDRNDDERFSMSYIHASIIPTYYPGFRIYEYNITGLDEAPSARVYEDGTPFRPWSEVFDDLNDYLTEIDNMSLEELDELDEETDGMLSTRDIVEIAKKKKKGKKKGKKGGKKKKPKKLDPTWPPIFENVTRGPAYDPQLFTPVKFYQYFLNMSYVNTKGNEFKYDIEYETDKAPYNMKSLVVSEWIKLAGRMTSYDNNDPTEEGEDQSPIDANKKLNIWEQFVQWAFASSGFEKTL